MALIESGSIVAPPCAANLISRWNGDVTTTGTTESDSVGEITLMSGPAIGPPRGKPYGSSGYAASFAVTSSMAGAAEMQASRIPAPAAVRLIAAIGIFIGHQA